MRRAARRRLADGRWHFQHGPIDCIVSADGEASVVGRGVEQAWRRFEGVLEELMQDLPMLRADLSAKGAASLRPRGSVAARMLAACRPHGERGTFITAMAAVAGSVAEELIAFFDVAGVERASVNNGGDIAVCLAEGHTYSVGLGTDPAETLAGRPLAGRFDIAAASPVRGIATSGWRGRSFSLGIADSVTVLARSASAADAAATVIANAVDVSAPGIVRRPACELRDDSDLGHRPVTCDVPRLAAAAVAEALAGGAAVAGREVAAGRIVAAALFLQGRWLRVDPTSAIGRAGRATPTAAAPWVGPARGMIES